MAQQFGTIARIGIGLICSSIAREIREKQLACTPVVSTAARAKLKRTQELGLGNRYTLSAAEAVRGADLGIVSVPVGAYGAVAAEIAVHLNYRHRCRLCQRLGDCANGGSAGDRSFHAGASDRRYRALRPGCLLQKLVGELLF